MAEGAALVEVEGLSMHFPVTAGLLRRRVGAVRPIEVNVRFIAATNRILLQEVHAGKFRDDLYYRINVVSIFLPPLRERRADIPPLVAHFVDRFNKDNGRQIKVTPEAPS